MAANDADDAYVMDLSERHLSSRGLHDALARLQRVLHDEDERDGVTIARPLELLCAGNDVAKFALPASEKPPRPEPAPRQRQPEPEPPTVESYAELHRSQGGLMDMMMGWQDDDEETVEDEDVYEEPPPPPPPPPPKLAVPLASRIVVLDLAGNRLGPDATPSSKALSSLKKLRTLNLADNGLESCAGLASLVNLEALFLQKNYLRSADGLWGLAKLSSLDLRDNAIRSVAALRPLSCNAALRSLDVRGNPLCDDAAKARDARARLRSVLVRLARLGVGPDARDAAPSSSNTKALADIKPAAAGGDSYAGTHRRQLERRTAPQTTTRTARSQPPRSRPAPPAAARRPRRRRRRLPNCRPRRRRASGRTRRPSRTCPGASRPTPCRAGCWSARSARPRRTSSCGRGAARRAGTSGGPRAGPRRRTRRRIEPSTRSLARSSASSRGTRRGGTGAA